MYIIYSLPYLFLFCSFTACIFLFIYPPLYTPNTTFCNAQHQHPLFFSMPFISFFFCSLFTSLFSYQKKPPFLHTHSLRFKHTLLHKTYFFLPCLYYRGNGCDDDYAARGWGDHDINPIKSSANGGTEQGQTRDRGQEQGTGTGTGTGRRERTQKGKIGLRSHKIERPLFLVPSHLFLEYCVDQGPLPWTIKKQ